MTNQQAPSEEYTAEDEAREKDIDWSKAEKVELPNLKRTEPPSESWEETARGVHYVGCESTDPNLPYGQCDCGAFADLRSMRAEAVEEYKQTRKGERIVPCCATCGNICKACHVGGGACSCCDCPLES